MEPIVSLTDLEARARAILDRPAFDYVAGGAGDEANLRANEAAFDRHVLVPRVLVDVSKRDLATEVLGAPVTMPVLAAPTAFHKLVHREGEEGTARGVAEAGTLLVASTLSTTPLEAVAEASPGPKWFQLYVYRDRALTRSLVERAEAAGYRALVLTVDAPVWGRRARDVRNGFTLPAGMGLANFEHLEQESLPALGEGADALAAYVTAQLDPSLTWETLDWLAGLSELPLVVKGLVHPDDARLARDHGAAAVVVSNHGGRQLGAGIATLDALPGVVDAVGDDLEVYVDGGVRSGSDVLIALGLGAKAVLVGRPLLYGLALGGAEGVRAVLEVLREELDNALALTGSASVRSLPPDLVRPVPTG